MLAVTRPYSLALCSIARFEIAARIFFSDGGSTLWRRIRQDHNERCANALRDRRQGIVAGLVPVGVVVHLEAIDIDKQQGQHAVRPLGTTPFLIEDLTKGAIVQPSQPIGARQHGQRTLVMAGLARRWPPQARQEQSRRSMMLRA